FSLAVPEGETTDLSEASPVGQSNGALIVRGPGVPPGGTTGQVLAKKSDANEDTEWVTVEGLTPPTLGELTDVEVEGVQDGETIVYDADNEQWVPGVAAGGGGDVASVNGQTGEVVLDAEDVGALPDTTALFTGDYEDLENKPS